MARFLRMKNMIDWNADNLHKNRNYWRLSNLAQVIIHFQRLLVLFDCLQNFGKKYIFQRIIAHKSSQRHSLSTCKCEHHLHCNLGGKATAFSSIPSERWQRGASPLHPAAAFSGMQCWNTTAADSATRRVVARVHSSKQSQSICQPAA